jgi:hypothetical protein
MSQPLARGGMSAREDEMSPIKIVGWLGAGGSETVANSETVLD